MNSYQHNEYGFYFYSKDWLIHFCQCDEHKNRWLLFRPNPVTQTRHFLVTSSCRHHRNTLVWVCVHLSRPSGRIKEVLCRNRKQHTQKKLKCKIAFLLLFPKNLQKNERKKKKNKMEFVYKISNSSRWGWSMLRAYSGPHMVIFISFGI